MQIPADGKSSECGISHKGNPIRLKRFGTGKVSLLLIGGVHGDEPEGFLFAEKFISSIETEEFRLPENLTLFALPRLNPDGCAANRRTNHHNVDLNRNMPTKDWDGEFSNVRYYPGSAPGSEPETKILTELIHFLKIDSIISLHSYEKPMINFNGDCENWAVSMSKKNGLPPKGDIGYPTPGSLGTYAGWERNIPTITLEILRDQDPKTVWETHQHGLLDALEFYTKNPLPQRKEP